MVAKVTMGHGFLGAYEKELTRRIVAVGNNYWMSDGKAGSPGFDGAGDVDDTTFQADSRRTLQAIVLWLTSSASGANILIVGVKPTYPTPSGVGAFGWQFSNALEAAGHTVTWTAVSLGFGAYDPANYDLVCLPDDLGSGELTQAEFDVLIADSTSFLINGENYTYEYGIDASAGPHAVHNETGHKIHFANNGPQTGDDAPGWQYQRPFDCSDFGDPGTGGSWNTNYYALSMSTTGGLFASGDSTKGGTTVFHQCALEQYGNHIHVDNDGLNVIATWQP